MCSRSSWAASTRAAKTRSLAALTLPNLVLTLGAWVTHYRAGQADSVEATAHRLYLHVAPTVAVMTAAAATVALGAVRYRHGDGHRSEVPTR